MGAAHAADAAPASTALMQGKVAMCIGCHGIAGYRSSFPELHKVPKISGQSAAYIASALTAYKAGDRKHPTMDGIAATDDRAFWLLVGFERNIQVISVLAADFRHSAIIRR